jgi:hypothetical protein
MMANYFSLVSAMQDLMLRKKKLTITFRILKNILVFLLKLFIAVVNSCLPVNFSPYVQYFWNDSKKKICPQMLTG